MKLRIHFLLAFLIAVKFLVGSVFVYRADLGSLFMAADAVAAEQVEDLEETARKDGEKTKEEAIDVKYLIMKKLELEKEEKQIAKKKAELLAIQDDINQRIAKLTKLRDEIRSEIDKKNTVEEQKFKHLIKVYSTMKPQSAAELIEKLDIKLAIKLLSKMKGDNVGKILSFVNIEKAAKISEGLVKKE